MPNEQGRTPPALAKRYGVKPEKVHHWIRTGELVAINVAASTSGRPRFIVTPEAIAAFEARRSSKPRAATPRTRRRKSAATIEFF